MEKVLTKVNGGVCAAKGFQANGLNCGLNPNKEKNDLGLVVSDVLCDTAAVYTSNKVKGAPITVTKANLEKSGKKSKAVIVNSKNANTCNADGVEKAQKMCQLTAEVLGEKGIEVKEEEVIVASTGVIGQILPIEPIANSMQDLVAGLSYEGNAKAANAIMTTDTVMKEYAVSFEAGYKGKSAALRIAYRYRSAKIEAVKLYINKLSCPDALRITGKLHKVGVFCYFFVGYYRK